MLVNSFLKKKKESEIFRQHKVKQFTRKMKAEPKKLEIHIENLNLSQKTNNSSKSNQEENLFC